jgi:hypothetical protein
VDPTLSGWDLVGIIAACVACGGAGGIGFDLTEPLIKRRRANAAPEAGDAAAAAEDAFGDNRVALPRFTRVGGRRFWEAGLFGPIFIGAVAALIAVFLLAINRPDAPSTIEVQALTTTLQAENIDAATISAVEEALETREPYVQWWELIPIALIAGFAGVAVLRTARSKLLAAIGAVAFEARMAGIHEGANVSAEAAAQQASDPTVEAVPPAAQPVIAEAISTAVEEHIEHVALSSPYGNPG